ncbi:MAG: hypothetical protein AB7J13_04110 [Pyrinomonadaceae bacterium]
MIELLPTLTTAIGLANKLKAIGDNLKHAELKELIGDLKLQLADLKIGMADLIEENDSLKRQVASIQNADGEPCPKCGHRTYRVESSKKDRVYGVMGGIRRTYLCGDCGFTEERLENMPR